MTKPTTLTLLYTAWEKGDAKTVRSLMPRVQDVDGFDATGLTPLMKAAGAGSDEAVRLSPNPHRRICYSPG